MHTDDHSQGRPRVDAPRHRLPRDAGTTARSGRPAREVHAADAPSRSVPDGASVREAAKGGDGTGPRLDQGVIGTTWKMLGRNNLGSHRVAQRGVAHAPI